jgi:hypothetical protein
MAGALSRNTFQKKQCTWLLHALYSNKTLADNSCSDKLPIIHYCLGFSLLLKPMYRSYLNITARRRGGSKYKDFKYLINQTISNSKIMSLPIRLSWNLEAKCKSERRCPDLDSQRCFYRKERDANGKRLCPQAFLNCAKNSNPEVYRRSSQVQRQIIPREPLWNLPEPKAEISSQQPANAPEFDDDLFLSIAIEEENVEKEKCQNTILHRKCHSNVPEAAAYSSDSSVTSKDLRSDFNSQSDRFTSSSSVSSQNLIEDKSLQKEKQHEALTADFDIHPALRNEHAILNEAPSFSERLTRMSINDPLLRGRILNIIQGMQDSSLDTPGTADKCKVVRRESSSGQNRKVKSLLSVTKIPAQLSMEDLSARKCGSYICHMAFNK